MADDNEDNAKNEPSESAASESERPTLTQDPPSSPGSGSFDDDEGPTLQRFVEDQPRESSRAGSTSDAPSSSEQGTGEKSEHASHRPAAGHAHAAHSHAAHSHAAEHGMSHLTPIPLLLAVFGGLVVFTIATVLVTGVDLGGEGNFIIAMIIATIKASLVMTFFMHLRWDSRFNVVVFLSSFLFVLLFLSLALTDRMEYQDMIDAKLRSDRLLAQ